MKNILFLVFVTIFIVACSNKHEYFNSKNDFVSNVDNKIIADDMYNFIIPYFLPNKTTFYIQTKDIDKIFYNYLVEKFRGKGYAITNNSNLENLTFLSYSIKEDNNIIFVTYSINETKINRIYIIQDNQLIPAGEITGFNFSNF
ncbi:hypothetical protein N5912_02620 [Arcobacter lacus]|uniref:hypothetical protein n=1 Tax=Arcobacter lacus TaxID=1912876 RepID=UPI0021BA6910|nr:hypothetical protein [Arcobacter lacus]MCT7910713.1 hypothetical protein [Arcobacter lacus]